MAIPGVSTASNAAAGDGEILTPPQTKSSIAANDRRVKLQHFLVMKAFNLRKEKQTVSQQFQFLKKHDDNQVSFHSLSRYLSAIEFADDLS